MRQQTTNKKGPDGTVEFNNSTFELSKAPNKIIEFMATIKLATPKLQNELIANLLSIIHHILGSCWRVSISIDKENTHTIAAKL